MKQITKNKVENVIIEGKVFFIVVLIALLLAFMTDTFLTPRNLTNVLRQVTVNMIVAAGFTLVLGSGLIDLSVGHLLGLCGVIMAKLMVSGVPVPIAILITTAFGIVSGIIAAACITFFNMPPFVVTLALSEVYLGTTYLITNMAPVSYLPDGFVQFGQGYLFGIPIPVYVMLIMCVLMYIIINKTRIGRHSIAMGSNPEAARVCGINIFKTRMFVFAVCGFCAAIGAVVQTARSASAQISAGDGMEMDAIAAVVIGGTSMAGGNARIVGTICGCLIVGLANNGLNLLGVSSNWQIIVKGLMILIAVLLDTLSSKFYDRRAQMSAEIKEEKVEING